jgi:hypothetical protein
MEQEGQGIGAEVQRMTTTAQSRYGQTAQSPFRTRGGR